MAKDRLALHELLLTFVPNVYHQPPSTITLKYPCIVYKVDDRKVIHANGRPYLGTKKYLVTVMDKDPDTLIYESILELPYCGFEKHFVANNVNHYVCLLHW